MILHRVLLFAGLVGSVLVCMNARRLADRPRRGTALRPSYRVHLVAAVALLLVAVGAPANLLGS